MHNKAWIADGRVGVIGGRNIGEEYFSADAEVNFRDLDLLLFGPAVQQASTIFDAYWNSSAAVPLAALGKSKPDDLRRVIAGIEAEASLAAAQPYLERVAQSQTVRAYHERGLHPRWTAGVEVIADPPLKWHSDDRSEWLVKRLASLLAATREKALLISPYFVPGDTVSENLVGMVRQGIEIGIVTNSLAANDVPAVHSGYARYRDRLLDGGVHLHEIKARGRTESAGTFGSSGASLHTKAFVADDARGFVGSFNLDPRSADLNTEMGVLFEDPAIAIELRNEYLRLTHPAFSYWVYHDADGALRWLDHSIDPPVVWTLEPDTGRWKRLLVRVLGWLPIESQL
jgi:putative cardiolipin synthase